MFKKCLSVLLAIVILFGVFTALPNVATGYCLDVSNAGSANETNIQLSPSNDTNAQRWHFKKVGEGYSLVPKCAPYSCMDVDGGVMESGRNIQIYKMNSSEAQVFTLRMQPSFDAIDMGTEFYANISNLASSKNIVVSEANVQIATSNSDDWQKWYFERQGDYSYKITNVATGKSLDVANFGTENGTNIQVMPWSDNSAQRWYFRQVGDGYSLIPQCAMNSCLDIRGGDISDGTNIQLHQQNSSDAQVFVISKLPSSEVTSPDPMYPPTDPPTTPPTTPPTEPPTVAVVLLGDVDGDGQVTIVDATAIQRHLASLPTTAYNEKRADADEDNTVSILDATAIQRYLASLPTNERIGKPMN